MLILGPGFKLPDLKLLDLHVFSFSKWSYLAKWYMVWRANISILCRCLGNVKDAHLANACSKLQGIVDPVVSWSMKSVAFWSPTPPHASLIAHSSLPHSCNTTCLSATLLENTWWIKNLLSTFLLGNYNTRKVGESWQKYFRPRFKILRTIVFIPNFSRSFSFWAQAYHVGPRLRYKL